MSAEDSALVRAGVIGAAVGLSFVVAAYEIARLLVGRESNARPKAGSLAPTGARGPRPLP